MADLTDTERDMLAFERENTWWRYEGRREAAILERFGMSRAEYGLAIVRLIRRPEALAHDPVTTRRLQRVIEQRSRTVRRLDVDL
jgi:hypothetical protein